MRLDRASRKFYNHLVERMAENKIKFSPRNVERLQYNGFPASGLFGEIDSPSYLAELEVAVKRPYDLWFPVLVHESCHMDQFLEGSPYWTGVYIIYEGEKLEGVDIIDRWVGGEDIPTEWLWKAADASIALEWDTERRAVAKIQEWGLPISVEEYTQKANSYLYSYRMALKLRRWAPKDRTPYLLPEVWGKMPTKLYGLSRYRNVPKRLEALLKKHCYPQES